MQNPTNWLIAGAVIVIIALAGYFVTKEATVVEQVKTTVQPKR